MQVVEANGAGIPIVGLGTWQLRGADCARLTQEALRLGYRHLDTAQAYENEAEVGDGLQASGIGRDAVFVTTKVTPPNFAPADFERSTKESLQKLKLDHVDLLLLHWPPPVEFTLGETLDLLCRTKKAGLTRHIGVSNFTIPLMEEAVKLSSEPLVCNQIEVHPYLDQDQVIATCRRLGFAVVAHCPIARGKIFGDPVIERIAKAHGRTAAQVALHWLVQQGIVIIPRSSKPERVAENFAVEDFELTTSEMNDIAGLKRPGSRLVSNPKWAPKWDA
jgi:diketogulonate reductase-like aldo/keto reductase